MSDKIVALRIKQNDGTYSDQIPIWTTADNIAYSNNYTISDVLGTIDISSYGTVGEQLNTLKLAVGGPLTATTSSQMIDTTKIYVYTGTTSGNYINGHWYYYNGSAWTQGGIYNETALETDKTLTVENAAADAKVTGDEITDLKSALDNKFDLSTGSDVHTISNGTNYNTLTDPGTYKCTTSANASSMINCPTTHGHRLVVMRTQQMDRFYQIVYANHVSVPVYLRFYSGSWSAWHALAYKDEILDIDETLTQSGQAADAKVTGNEITDLKSALNRNAYDVLVDTDEWPVRQLTLAISTGAAVESTTCLTTKSVLPYSIRKVVANDGYLAQIFAYDGYTYIGVYNGNGYQTTSSWSSEIDIPINDYTHRLVIRRTDNADISLEEQSNVICYGRDEINSDSFVIENLVNDTIKDTTIDLSSYSIGQVVNITPRTRSGWRCRVVPCKKMDKFAIMGNGGSVPRMWGFLDKECKLVNMESASTIYTTPVTLYAPCDGYFIANLAVAYHLQTLLYYNNSRVNDLDAMELTNWVNTRTVNISGFAVNAVVPFETAENANACYQIIPCVMGQMYRLNGISEYALLNHQNNLIKYANTDGILFVTDPGVLVVNAETNKNPTITVYPKNIKKKLFELFENVEHISSVPFDRTSYIPYDTLISSYDTLLTNHLDVVTKQNIGKDASGTYDMFRYDITPKLPSQVTLSFYENTTITADKCPTIFLDACIHGSERPCALALLNFVGLLLESDMPIFQWLRSHIRFVIVPIVNPWGYVNALRVNSNTVDLARNNYIFWGNGDATTAKNHYRGASPASEAETQHICEILNELEPYNSIYYDFHTHGVWSAYEEMTAYNFPIGSEFQKIHCEIGTDAAIGLTNSGHKYHNLPSNSGYIGIVQVARHQGLIHYYAESLGILAACPECMYQYYDGTSGTTYNSDVNAMNAEYILRCVYLACKYYLFAD